MYKQKTAYKILSRLGGSEMCIRHSAKAVPDLTIILCHVGGLLGTGVYAGRQDEVMEAWRKGITAAAEQPNIVIKLGGIGMPSVGNDWHLREKPIGSEELAAAMGPTINYCIE